ncbi:MAG: cupin domain-containing protein [Chloroflexota bacterium]
MTPFKNIQEHIGSNPEKLYKTTLHQGQHLLLGLNCLEPRQAQAVHTHAEQDKFYYVVEGKGQFTLGEDKHTVTVGHSVWAPAGMAHGVANNGDATLVILMGMSPPPTPK